MKKQALLPGYQDLFNKICNDIDYTEHTVVFDNGAFYVIERRRETRAVCIHINELNDDISMRLGYWINDFFCSVTFVESIVNNGSIMDQITRFLQKQIPEHVEIQMRDVKANNKSVWRG